MNAARVESIGDIVAEPLLQSVVQNQMNKWRNSRFSWHSLQSSERKKGSSPHNTMSSNFGLQALPLNVTLIYRRTKRTEPKHEYIHEETEVQDIFFAEISEKLY